MPTNPDVLLLARALAKDLVTADQVSELLRELERDEAVSISVLLKSRGLLSDDQVDSLLAGRENGSAQGERASSLPPVSGLSSPSAPRLARGSTVKSDATAETQEFTPGGPDANDRAAGPAPDNRASSGDGLEIESRQHYVMMMEIGRGGLGRVRLAYDRQINREVAVKELLPHSLRSTEKVNRFLREAKVTGQLEHPGIVPIYATGLDQDGNPFYVMKRIGGRTLVQAISEYHALSASDPARPRRLNELLATFRSICQTMAFVHRRGVLHRDLKPQNVIVGDFGEAIIVDWGLAKVFRRDAHAGPSESTIAGENFSGELPAIMPSTDPELEHETQLGTVVGTIAYMPPEQARGEPTDHRADIYALGAILFDLLAGEPPLRGKGPAILEQVKRGEVRDLRTLAPDAPRALIAVCRKAMARNPQDRYQSAKELAEEIVRWQSGEPPLAYEEPLLERAYRWARRHRTLCLTVAASVAVLAITLAVWSWQDRRRIARVQEMAQAHLRTAQRMFYRREFEAARPEIAEAGAIASGERRLASMLGPINDLRSQIDAQLKSEANAAAMRRRFAQFQQAYDAALFHGLLASGPDGPQEHRQALAAAGQALALFPLEADVQHASLAGANTLSADQWREIRDKQQELLFVQADLVARGEADHDNVKGAQQALAILARLPAQPPLRAVHLRRAQYLQSAGRTADARAEVNLANQVQPALPLDLFVLGDEYFRSGKYAEAARQFQATLQRDANRFWAQCFLAMTQLQLAHYQEAIANLTACAARRPNFPWVFLLRGLAYGLLEDETSAEADFQSALDRTDSQQGAYRYAIYLNRGIARLRLGRLARAIEDFRQAVDLDKTRWEGPVNLAAALRAEEDRRCLLGELALAQSRLLLPVTLRPSYEAALAQLARAIDLAPNEPRPYLSRGGLRRDLGNTAGALADFGNAIAVSRARTLTKAQALCEYGKVLHQQNNHPEALRRYNAALAEYPDYPPALYLRGLVLMDLNNAPDAVASLDQFLARSKLLGQVYQGGAAGAKRPSGGGNWLSGAEETEHGDADPRLQLATLYRERALARMKLRDSFGGFHDSLLAFDLVGPKRESLTSEDRDRFANLASRRGWALLIKNAELARASFDEAIRLEAGVADPYAGRGCANVQLRRYQDAAADAQLALQRASAVPGLLYNVASIYAGLVGQLRRDPDPPADAKAQVERWTAEAIRLLRNSFEQMPQAERPFYLDQFRLDPTFDSIRHLPEVQQLTSNMRPGEPGGTHP